MFSPGHFLVRCVALFARVRGLRLARLADIAAPGLVLAQAIGREAMAEFGEAYARYAANTPAFFPCLRQPRPSGRAKVR
jgi:prolipoprotein diacylglyceryltransferase